MKTRGRSSVVKVAGIFGSSGNYGCCGPWLQRLRGFSCFSLWKEILDKNIPLEPGLAGASNSEQKPSYDPVLRNMQNYHGAWGMRAPAHLLLWWHGCLRMCRSSKDLRSRYFGLAVVNRAPSGLEGMQQWNRHRDDRMQS